MVSQWHGPHWLHGFRLGSPTSCNPGLDVLEVPCEITNVGGQLPGQIQTPPLKNIPLYHKGHHQSLVSQVGPTQMIVLPNGMPAHSSDEIAWHMAGLHLKMGLNGQEVISNQKVDVS